MGNHIYRFGSFRIDPAKRELRCNDELLPMQPKVFDCLAYLIEQRDRAVGRDELIAAVWGKVDIPYAQLGQIIIKIRRAVGCTGNAQHAIRTVSRFGYRWAADVEVDEDAKTLADMPSRPSPGEHAHLGRRVSKPIRLAWLLLALVAIATSAS